MDTIAAIATAQKASAIGIVRICTLYNVSADFLLGTEVDQRRKQGVAKL